MEDEKTTGGAKEEEPSKSNDDTEIVRLGDDIGEAKTSPPANSYEAADDESAAPKKPKQIATFPFPLKMTQQVWVIAAGLFLLLAMVLVFGRGTGKNKAAGEVREERSVDSLTPESLIAKCGQPAEDETKDLYPMIKRTISFKSGGKGTLTLEFSRTAEEKSDWVFLSMSDENGARFATPETQMAAMPCLK